jgi:predicted nuclease of predicted toxin-antitoxin system
MRFKIDENLPVEVANLLAEDGHDAKTVPDQNLGGRSDPDIASVCRTEGRALITLDGDFGDVRAYPPSHHPGLIVLRLSRQGKNQILQVLPRVMRLMLAEPLDQHLWIVDEHRVRIRG